ncbi:DUF2345 domain-containing protein, partial [Azonexus caeni]|uniref:DUF2345 domain-containing protein n=1 Tax=Azonexus caeni TaxID=266126 RepID=UPI003A8AF0DB
SNDEIHILANKQIRLVGGQSSVTLEGSNITFACPGTFSVKGSSNAFTGPGSGEAVMEGLPESTIYRERFQVKDRATGMIKANERYWITANGQTVEGITDDQGWTETVYTDSPQSITLEIEQDGLELKA